MSSALSNSNGGGKVFLKVMDGKIVQAVKEGTEGAESRVNKNGVTVWEKKYNKLKGVIEKVESRISDDYGDTWEIQMDFAGEKYQLSLGQSSRYGSMFVNRLLNYKQGEIAEINTWSVLEDGKQKGFLTMTDAFGNKILPKYNKDNPGDLPPLVKTKIKGKEVWDDSDQIEHYRKLVLSLYGAAQPSSTPPPGEKAPGADDLPF